MSSWSNQSKNSAAFSNQSKNTASWVNQGTSAQDSYKLKIDATYFLSIGDGYSLLIQGGAGAGTWAFQTKN